MKRLAFLTSALVLTAVMSATSVCFLSASRAVLPPYVIVPKPPVPRINYFPCISSVLPRAQNKRIVSLCGPDWVLESRAEPACFPERDVIVMSQINRFLVNRPIEVRTHMWITKRWGRTFVRIVDSSGNEERDMIAMGLATNHACTNRTSKHCLVEGGPRLVRVD